MVMKKIFLLILFSASLLTFLVFFLRSVLTDSNAGKNRESSKIFLQDDYISENQRKIDVLHYNLEFDLYPEIKKLIATAEIKGVILDSAIKTIDLNFYDNFLINKVTLNQRKTSYEFNGKTFSVIPVAGVIDTFIVKVSYEGTPERAGLAGFVFGKRDGISLVYTLSEPTYASSWFPCNDIPTDKSLLDMRITNDSSMTSVSNGVLIGEEISGDRKTYHWKTFYPISTYLIALYSSDYLSFCDKYISLDGLDTMSLQYYVLPDKLDEARIDFSEHVNILEFFAGKFGEYPFIKEKYGVAEFLWRSGAMENQTITGVASSLIGGKKFFLDIFIHELAHHWWGNAVSPKSWKDIWLNEGFSSYSEALYFESKGGPSSLGSTMRDKYYQDFEGKLSEPGSYLFTRTVYDKGAWVLHMLRKEIGDSTFFKTLREYFKKYKYLNASTSDFIEVCENVSKRNLEKFFDQWLNGEGEIELEYEWDVYLTKNGLYKSTIVIEQVQEEYQFYDFPLQIRLNLRNDRQVERILRIESESELLVLNTEIEPISIKLDPDGWLLATISEK
jgi:aminopeptidase N